VIHTIYVLKLLFFFILGGVVVATATSHLLFWDVASWWNQPVVYQKVILWTVFLEALNVAGSWGPLVGKFKPMTGGVRFWAKLGTIRQRPWKWVRSPPVTTHRARCGALRAALASLVVAMAPPGVITPSLAAALPHNTTGLVDPVLLIAPVVLLVLVGLRTRRSSSAPGASSTCPALFFFAALPFVDMIIRAEAADRDRLGRRRFSPSSASTSPTWFPMVSTARSCRSSGSARALPRLSHRYPPVPGPAT